MSEEPNERWAIPFSVGYSNLVKIIRFIKNNNGSSKHVPLKTLLNLSSINSGTIKQNLSFSEITGITEGDSEKGYKLTAKGSAYADALTMDKPEPIQKSTLEIIENSHLNDLKTFVTTEGEKLSKTDFFKFVKSKANISDGPRFGNMPPTYSTGTGALFDMFSKACLMKN